MDSFFSEEELQKIGFKSLGRNVQLSRKASIYAPELMEIGDHVRIDDFSFLSGQITLENHIHIAPFCALIGGSEGAGIIMRSYSGLSCHVTVYSISDDYSGEYMTNPTLPSEFTNIHRGLVGIGKYVIVGASSTILPGVDIGEGAAVGAMSLVAKSLPEWKICSGIPARALKDRSKRIIELDQQLLNKNMTFV
jgi:galactoside O-acetyltransferase